MLNNPEPFLCVFIHHCCSFVPSFTMVRLSPSFVIRFFLYYLCAPRPYLAFCTIYYSVVHALNEFMKQSRMSSPLNRTSSTDEEDQSLWLAEIKELKGKRPPTLTEEQTTDILVAYRSLQVQDMKRKMKHPGQSCRKGYYQRQVSSVLGYSSKMVGLTYYTKSM